MKFNNQHTGAGRKPRRKEKEMAINTMLSRQGCRRMVNEIREGKTPDEIRERCKTAEEWLSANKVIDSLEYSDLMMAVKFYYRESWGD